MNSGHRIGSEFLWIDVDTLTVSEGDGVVIITARDRYIGAPIIRRELATWDHVHSLKQVAARIEQALVAAENKGPSE
jgi:hypothetical protein